MLFDETYTFNIFKQAMKFDCLFLAVFQSFYWFLSSFLTN